eukprot:12401083-Karenia_brevis.AAC.1
MVMLCAMILCWTTWLHGNGSAKLRNLGRRCCVVLKMCALVPSANTCAEKSVSLLKFHCVTNALAIWKQEPGFPKH